jgi:hypothetical protein
MDSGCSAQIRSIAIRRKPAESMRAIDNANGAVVRGARIEMQVNGEHAARGQRARRESVELLAVSEVRQPLGTSRV